MQTANSLEKTLMLGKIEGRRRGQQRRRWLDGITDSMYTSLVKESFYQRKSLKKSSLTLEKPLESPLDYKEIKSVNPKGNQPWIFTGRTDAEAEAPILWPHDARSRLIRKDPERLKAGGEGDDRGWDGWMASPTHWTWVWASSVASWPAYRFLKRQVRWSGISISFRIIHNLLWSTQSKALA